MKDVIICDLPDKKPEDFDYYIDLIRYDYRDLQWVYPKENVEEIFNIKIIHEMSYVNN